LSDFDRVRCGSTRLFLVRNWCGAPFKVARGGFWRKAAPVRGGGPGLYDVYQSRMRRRVKAVAPQAGWDPLLLGCSCHSRSLSDGRDLDGRDRAAAMTRVAARFAPLRPSHPGRRSGSRAHAPNPMAACRERPRPRNPP
jgi:hypothetical protein